MSTNQKIFGAILFGTVFFIAILNVPQDTSNSIIKWMNESYFITNLKACK